MVQAQHLQGREKLAAMDIPADGALKARQLTRDGSADALAPYCCPTIFARSAPKPNQTPQVVDIRCPTEAEEMDALKQFQSKAPSDDKSVQEQFCRLPTINEEDQPEPQLRASGGAGQHQADADEMEIIKQWILQAGDHSIKTHNAPYRVRYMDEPPLMPNRRYGVVEAAPSSRQAWGKRSRRKMMSKKQRKAAGKG